ncbi:hypothetical protein [Pantoea dispersa]|uniref:hypothetical protein n=1 Tax=Pantoea dispersa TaxID=59814 RepID=UPI0024AF1CDD|nr:hypothetical protein [Pantoea dispersa]MDI6637264.1 hypothetical protein [Pantoea dispersa]
MEKEKIKYYMIQFEKIKSFVENENRFREVLIELIKCNIEIECAGKNIPEDIQNRLFYVEYIELKPKLEKYLEDNYGEKRK